MLVAYTIEADGEFEASMPHRTALSRSIGERPNGPWLISLAMWENFLRYVPEVGISLAELSARVGIRTLQTAGMTRWGYVAVVDEMVRLKPGGRAAARAWDPIESRVESRWRERFGTESIDSLRSAIASSVANIREVGPNYLPVVDYGLWSARQLRADRDPTEQRDSLSALLSRALTVIAVAFERTSPVSIALAANALRVLEPAGTAVREVSSRAGIAREITDVSLGYLEKRGFATLASDGRRRTATLTRAGAGIQEFTDERLDELDGRFEPVRAALEAILSNTEALEDALTPHPSAWRAQPPYAAQTKRMLAEPRAALPHFPIVTHRGGYPDGS